ncbi:MAG TPA: hypothetical protein VMU77_02120 [Acidimicrobiales bacterium]|nr:hypothetical protein [Acidimicrobiales bacterium]
MTIERRRHYANTFQFDLPADPRTIAALQGQDGDISTDPTTNADYLFPNSAISSSKYRFLPAMAHLWLIFSVSGFSGIPP